MKQQKTKNLIPAKNSPDLDRVYTPPNLANAIVKHFKPNNRVIEPAAGTIGKQSFVSAVLNYSPNVNQHELDWYELDEGRDFLTINPSQKHYTWSIGNWPYSKFRKFLIKNMEVADNIITLCPINHVMGLVARLRDIKEHGFYIREIMKVKKPKEWASSGFAYAAILLNKEKGDIKMGELEYEE